MPKNTLHNKCKLLVSHFCSQAKFISWGKEIKIAKKLLAENSDVKFWLSLQTPNPVFSLSWFLTKDGKDFLQVSKLKSLVTKIVCFRSILKTAESPVTK